MKGEFNPVETGLGTLQKNYEEIKYDINEQRVTFEVYDDLEY